MSKRLMQRFEQLVDEIIEKISMGEDLDYEIGVMPHPQLGPCWLVFMFLPSPIIGSDPFTMTSVIANMPGAIEKPDVVEGILRDGLEKLKTGRSEALSAKPPETPSGAPQGPQNGPLLPPGVTSFGNNGQGASTAAQGQ